MSLHAAASAERHDTPVAGTPAGTEAPAHRPSVAPAPKTRGRVLVVDDEPSTRRAIRMGVEASGYEVETAYDGTTALKLFTSGRPFDVVVSDVSMPNMDGVDLLREIRRTDYDIPVILVTGSPDDRCARDAVENGALMYLVKPLDFRLLDQMIAHAMQLHRLARIKRIAWEHLGVTGDRIGDRGALDGRFRAALEKLWIAFQPIVRWHDQSVVGYEALVRSDEETMRDPGSLIAAAERLGKTTLLGRTIRSRIAESIPNAPGDAMIFVNLHPEDLRDELLLSDADPLRPFAERIVLEITEREALDRIDDLSRRIDRLRFMGYRIAVDDLGAGYAGLNSFAQLKPWVVKIDMALVRGIDTDPVRYNIVRAVLSLCQEIGVQVIGEGVETEAERQTLGSLGCELQQGYMYARPARGFATA